MDVVCRAGWIVCSGIEHVGAVSFDTLKLFPIGNLVKRESENVMDDGRLVTLETRQELLLALVWDADTRELLRVFCGSREFVLGSLRARRLIPETLECRADDGLGVSSVGNGKALLGTNLSEKPVQISPKRTAQ